MLVLVKPTLKVCKDRLPHFSAFSSSCFCFNILTSNLFVVEMDLEAKKMLEKIL